MLEPAALGAKFLAAGVDVSNESPLYLSCGSGVTASVIALALDQLGRSDVSLYDGSWAEWGSRNDLPIATGPART